MGILHQDERSFWKTANPRRIQIILNALYLTEVRPEGAESIQKGKKRSLSEYLMGGG